MLKTVRSLAIDNPWCLRLLMVAIAVVFVITMGWWGFDRPDKNGEAVADVGGARISWEEYQDSYEALRRAAQAQMKDQFNEEVEKALNLRRVAIDRLISARLWENAAQEAGIRVSDDEIASLVRGHSAFRGKNGAFDRGELAAAHDRGDGGLTIAWRSAKFGGRGSGRRPAASPPGWRATAR